jgi:uncharacterized membrane protein
MKDALRYLLALVMVFAGVMHFVAPKAYARTVPKWLPAPMALVYISGVFEVLGGLGLLVPQTRALAAWGLVALFVAVFPANVNMAQHGIGFGKKPTPPESGAVLGNRHWGLGVQVPNTQSPVPLFKTSEPPSAAHGAGPAAPRGRPAGGR